MEKFIINGGKELSGKVRVSGAKNVALKAIVAACLTDEEVVIENVPLITDLFVMMDIVKQLGGKVEIKDHKLSIVCKEFNVNKISLEKAAEIRTSSMMIAPLLARFGRAIIPNPGGCRIGARPIDRTIEGLRRMGVSILYDSRDGYFHAKIMLKNLQGAHCRFKKNTHTGTETLILASVLAEGKTVLENAALEPEVDEMISLLNKMGAKIKRTSYRTIVIEGVKKLHGTNFVIGPDRNEIVTFAIAAMVTGGEVFVENVTEGGLLEFLVKLKEVGAAVERSGNGLRFFSNENLKAANIETSSYPGFMTDWQSPWAVLMTKAKGESIIHETVYENRFGYVKELIKLGAKVNSFSPKVKNPEKFYNFNLSDDKNGSRHAIKIYGPTVLHNGVVSISDLRAGATLVLAALAARGQSTIYGVEHLDRGYESFEKRLRSLGADIRRVAID